MDTIYAIEAGIEADVRTVIETVEAVIDEGFLTALGPFWARLAEELPALRAELDEADAQRRAEPVPDYWAGDWGTTAA